ncbi:MAG: hypothetical protein KDE27_21940 [Planctomycetes bacterium]|nr:hypothetical protein [Planctomycetota bacterium]
MNQLALTLALGASCASAQTFIVDVNNGPGTQFTEIVDAVAAVPDGAVLEVRAGQYLPFLIDDKSLSLLGEPGVVVSATTEPAAIEIRNLASHRGVALRQIGWTATFNVGVLNCHDCRGAIVVDRCAGTIGSIGARLVASSCDRLALTESTVYGFLFSPALDLTDTDAVLSGCAIRANAAPLRVTRGRVHLSQFRCENTLVLPSAGSLCRLTDCDVVVNGATQFVAPGANPQSIASGTGRFVYDPDTQQQNIASPAFASGIQVTVREVPLVTASTAALGGAAIADLTVPSGGLGWLHAGFLQVPTFFPGIADPCWLGAMGVLVAAGPAPNVHGSYSVPNAAWLLGVQVTWQGTVLDGAGAIALANPVSYAHF